MSNHEGSAPRRRWDGRWTVDFTWTDRDGRRHRTSVYARTRRDVVEKARAVSRRLEDGAPARDAAVTLADYVEAWIGGTLAASSRKPATKDNYKTIARRHVASSPLGSLPLARVTPTRVEAWTAELATRRAASTTRTCYTVLRGVLDTAATAMLTNGVPITVVSRILGHQSIQVTVDLYAHLAPEVSRSAADILGDALGL